MFSRADHREGKYGSKWELIDLELAVLKLGIKVRLNFEPDMH